MSSTHAYCFIFALTILFSCANETTPDGGPKDVTRPKLIASIPSNRQTNYREKSVRMDFDEFVETNQPNKNILIVPSVGKEVKYIVRGKSVIIEPKDKWSDSTTYTISIGEGIRDITEGNTPNKLKLSFSTGPYIDSLSVFGEVRMALTNSLPKDKKAIVGLYPSDTSSVFEDTPYYFTETEKDGKFRIDNIHEGKYYVYSFLDTNGNFKAESGSETYGFLKDHVILNGEKSDSIHLRLVDIDPKTLLINSIVNNGVYTRVIFNKPLARYKLNYSYDSTVTHSYGSTRSEVVIYNPKNIKDSIQFSIHGEAIPEARKDSTFYIAKKEKSKSFVGEKFTLDIKELTLKIDSSVFRVQIGLSKPIKKITHDSIFIPIDSARKINFSGRDIFYDTLEKVLLVTKDISNELENDSLLAKGKKMSIFFGKNFLLSVENDSSKGVFKEIRYIKKESLGTLLVEIKTEKSYYIIQLVNEKGEVMREARNVSKFKFEDLDVQNYGLRVVVDKNNNGRWDAGNINKREEPEEIVFYKTIEGEYTFPIRSNWEVGPLIINF